jgi:Uma2 family endonuclease
MVDNTKQFRWIVMIQQNLEQLFNHNPDVFVAGDLPWYPVKNSQQIYHVPNVMVVFGRPKCDRSVYQQWQEGKIPPQVVFEILSSSDMFQLDRGRKMFFYNRFGVEEYYLYDLDTHEFSVWLRTKTHLDEVEPGRNWISPRLNIRFASANKELQLFHPNGERFLTYLELTQQLEQERQKTDRALQCVSQLSERLRKAGISPDISI